VFCTPHTNTMPAVFLVESIVFLLFLEVIINLKNSFCFLLILNTMILKS
jgi:hypothetical protein